MTERLLRVRVRMVTGEFTRGIRQITSGVRASERTQTQATRRTTREAERGAAARTRAEQRAAREATREANALARTKTRLTAQTTREAERAARAVAAAEARGARDSAREAQALFRIRQGLHRQEAQAQARTARQQRRFRTSSLAVGGALAAGGIGMAAAAFTSALESMVARIDTITQAVSSHAGVQDLGQRTVTGEDFDLAMRRSASEFFQGQSVEEQTASMGELQAEILGVAQASAQSPTALLNVLSTMQSELSQFDAGRANLASIANEATRTGAEMETLGRFVGVLNQQLGETAPSADRAFDIMAMGGLHGAITPESFAENFGGMLGQFQVSSGLQGEDALRQFMGLANAIRPGAQSDAEAATQMHGLIEALGTSRTRGHIADAFGGRSSAFRADGTVDYMQLIRDMSTVEDSAEGLGVAEAFRNAGARDATISLTRAERGETTAPSADVLSRVSAEEGAAFRAQGLELVSAAPALASRRGGVSSEIEGIGGMAPRADEANQRIAFGNVTRHMLPDWMPDMGQGGMMASALFGASQWASERAGATGSSQRQFMETRADAWDPEAMLVQWLAGIGDETTREQARMSGAAPAAKAPNEPIRIAPGAVVALDSATVDAIAAATSGTRVATATAPPAPSSRRVGTARR